MKRFDIKKTLATLLACVLTFTATGAVTGNIEAQAVPVKAAVTPSAGDFTPPDLSGYIRWDGKSDFQPNTKYYIDGSAKINEKDTFTLPADSTLYLAEKASLRTHVDSTFNLNGKVLMAPRSNFTVSGLLNVPKGSSITNYGTFITTPSSLVELYTTFTSYSGSTTVFCGTTNIYKDGRFDNYGRATVSQNSVMTITGVVRSYDSSRLLVDGEVRITLSGRLAVAGVTVITGSLITSGTLTIERTVDLRVDSGAVMAKMRSGRYDDYRIEPIAVVRDNFVGGIKGIDVSYWQGVIDWKKVADAGVKFAIIRSSYSNDKVDKMFEYNVTEAKKAGIYVGVYHYCYAWTEEEAREEARFFLETIKPYEIDFPVMFDFEDNSQISLGKEKLTSIAKAFLDEIKNAGYYPMLYSYKNWLVNYLDMDKLSEYEVAVAEWNVPKSTYDGKYGIWQYSCTGLVSGINGDVDLDICYKDYAKIIREGGWNHLSK
ncbi:MAG: glycoside hydrolase family 25 protein [Oscillospiraceae bacterium]